MVNSGCLSKSITIVQQNHDCMMVKFLDERDEWEAFPVTNGVKQGYFLAPTLFRMYILGHTDWYLPWLPGRNTGQIKDWGGLFNLRRLKDVIKVKETVIRDFLFAADCMKWTAYLKVLTTSALPTAPKMKSCIRLHLAECNSDPIKVRVRIKAVESEFLFGSDCKKWAPVLQKTINIPYLRKTPLQCLGAERH